MLTANPSAQGEHFHENTTVEIFWTVIPFLILIAMAWPATKTILELKDTTSPDITIRPPVISGNGATIT